MQDRFDGIDEYYKSISRCDWWISKLFWSCVIISLIVPYSNKFPKNGIQQIPAILFMVLVVAYSAVWIYRGFILVPRAEKKRRQQLLSDSFLTPLTPERTIGYYNNELAPSIARLGASILENSFFAKRVCEEMANMERIKVLLYALLWLTAISCRSTDLGVLLSITQALFAGEILIHWIKLESLTSRNNTIYNELYNHFLHQFSHEENTNTAIILDSFASYEAAKEAFGISQSSKIFHRLNPILSEEWNEIKRQLRLDNNHNDN